MYLKLAFQGLKSACQSLQVQKPMLNGLFKLSPFCMVNKSHTSMQNVDKLWHRVLFLELEQKSHEYHCKVQQRNEGIFSLKQALCLSHNNVRQDKCILLTNDSQVMSEMHCAIAAQEMQWESVQYNLSDVPGILI